MKDIYKKGFVFLGYIDDATGKCDYPGCGEGAAFEIYWIHPKYFKKPKNYVLLDRSSNMKCPGSKIRSKGRGRGLGIGRGRGPIGRHES